MQRYKLEFWNSVHQSQDGDWVRYEDVVGRMRGPTFEDCKIMPPAKPDRVQQRTRVSGSEDPLNRFPTQQLLSHLWERKASGERTVPHLDRSDLEVAALVHDANVLKEVVVVLDRNGHIRTGTDVVDIPAIISKLCDSKTHEARSEPAKPNLEAATTQELLDHLEERKHEGMPDVPHLYLSEREVTDLKNKARVLEQIAVDVLKYSGSTSDLPVLVRRLVAAAEKYTMVINALESCGIK